MGWQKGQREQGKENSINFSKCHSSAISHCSTRYKSTVMSGVALALGHGAPACPADHAAWVSLAPDSVG